MYLFRAMSDLGLTNRENGKTMANTIRRKRWEHDDMRDHKRNPDSAGVEAQRRAFRAGERQRLRNAARDGGDALSDHYARPWRVDRYVLPTW